MNHLLIGSIGVLMPVWLFAADFACQLAGTEMSGKSLYVSVLAGVMICAAAIVATRLSLMRRILFIGASWLLLAAEVLAIGAIGLIQSGQTGTR